MTEILENLLLPLGILVLLGGLFFVVLVTAAVRVGEGAAIGRLKRWGKVPEALLRLSTSPNVEAAVQGMTASLAAALGASGALAVLREGTEPKLVAAQGTLAGATDRETLAAVRDVPALEPALWEEGAQVAELSGRGLPRSFKETFSGARRGAWLLVPFRFRGGQGGAGGYMLLHLQRRARLDRYDREALAAAVEAFPSVVEAVTARFAQAEVMEGLLAEARVKDDLLRMLLASYQHDLGNTLAALQGGLLQTWEESGELTDPESLDPAFLELFQQIELAATVARSGDSLVEMAKGDEPVVNVSPQDPAELYAELIVPYMALRERRRPELAVTVEVPDGLPAIEVDRTAFFRAFSNVLHNAFKFTREGGISVQSRVMGDMLHFVVADTGPGIPEAELASIGEYGFHGSAGAEEKGRGLGLWVTVRLLEEMGGSLSVESRVGEGSLFTLAFARSAGEGRPE